MKIYHLSNASIGSKIQAEIVAAIWSATWIEKLTCACAGCDGLFPSEVACIRNLTVAEPGKLPSWVSFRATQ